MKDTIVGVLISFILITVLLFFGGKSAILDQASSFCEAEGGNPIVEHNVFGFTKNVECEMN